MGTENNCLRCVVLDSLLNIEEEEEKIILPQAHVLKGWSSTGGNVSSRNFRRKNHIEDIALRQYLVLTLSCVESFLATIK